jgi:hypothetical protein
MHNETLTEGAVQVSQDTQEALLQTQSENTKANALNRGETSLRDTRDHLDEIPTFIYSYESYTGQLHRTSLVTGEHSSHRVPSYRFNEGCCWSEVPEGSLLITGGMNGFDNEVREVVRIDTRREFAVAHCAPMLTPRFCHAAVYHTPHLYILGGYDGRYLSERGTYVQTSDGKLCLLSLELARTRVE